VNTAPTKLFDLAGATDAAALAARWPADLRWENGDYDATSAATLLDHLQAVLEFRDIVSAVAPASPSPAKQSSEPAVSVSADIHVNLANAGGAPLGVVHRRLPDFCLRLVSTDGTLPARLRWTRFEHGESELVLLGLPVQIEPPADFLSSADDDPLVVDFDVAHPDSFGVRVVPLDAAVEKTWLKCFVTLRLTRHGQILIQPTVPISLGRCIFMGLPCRAVHDLALYPDVVLQEPAHVRELPIGWAASEKKLSVLAERVGSDNGLVTVRTLELDRESPAVKEVYDFFKTEQPERISPDLEIPIDDVGLAFDAEGGQMVPAYPVFGQTGIRRAVHDDTAAAEPFDHTLAPVRFSIKDWVFVFIHRCLLALRELPEISFDLAITRTAVVPEVRAVTVNFTQDFTLTLGYVWAEPQLFFRVGDTFMSFLAFRAGAHLKKIKANEGDSPKKFLDWFDAVFDLALVGSEQSKGKKISFRTRSGGRLDLVLRDVGWKDGKPSISAWVPDGISLEILGARGFHIDEIGLATTTHGATYFKLSASYQVGGKREVAGPADAQQHPPGNGIWVRGMRIRVQEPDDTETPWLAIDGIALSFRRWGLTIEGGGWMRDEIVEGNRVQELGFGIRFVKKTASKEFVIGGTFVKGSVESAERTTEYILAGLTVGPVPLWGFTLLKGSGLVAQNFVPRLPAPSGGEQNLRMFQWYRAQPAGLELPPGRILGAWEVSPDSWTFGLGLRLILGNTSVLKLDAFGLLIDTPATWSLLIGLELRFKDVEDPIGWLAVEYDDASGRVGGTGGLAIGLNTVLDRTDLPELAEVIGSAYAGNEPRTIAIGHIEDVDSWLQFKVEYERFELLLRVGFCFYDYHGDPKITAYGFVVTGRGRFKIPRLTEVKFLLEVSVMLGSFSSEGRSAGIRASVVVALSVKVWRIRFGLKAKIQIEHIRPYPDAGTATLDFTIETPWWLPDIHISHTWTFGGEPEIEAADVMGLPVHGAQALGLAGGTAVDLAVPLPAGAGDASRSYSLGELAQLGLPAPDNAVFEGLTPVPVDSVIAIDFAATMTDQLGTGETTPLAASRQENGELYADYEVFELGVRRRARFGQDAGVWTTLIAPEDTSTAAVDPVNDTVDELVAKFTSELSMRWDRDVVLGGKLDARRLLVNAATPFTLTTANPIADDALVRDPHATCCGKRSPLPWVKLDFESSEVGVRLPRVTPFPGDAAHVRWHGLLPPVVTAAGFSRRARIPLTGRAGTTLATIRFDRPAARVWGRFLWSAAAPVVVRLELHRGLEVAAVHDLVLDPQQDAVVELKDGAGGDQLVIRLIGPGGPVPLPTLYIDTLAYVGVDQLTDWLLGLVRCESGGTLASGTLAWLPNHDYELAISCRTTVGHDRVGTASVPVRQTALFRTKGWPGLNAPATPGGDLAPFVEASYPRRPEQLLYRDEPILLAMNERFAPLAPAVEAPPTAPPERRQLLEWSMLVDRMGAGDQGAVATYSSPDWLTENRPGPPGPLGWGVDAVVSHVREARSLDPRFHRLDGIRRSPANCQPHDPTLHSSRVFMCAAPPEGWEHSAYRARVVQRHGPYAMRTAFEPEDLTALTMVGGGWTVEEGVLVAPDGGEAWAVLGDPAWVHVQLAADLDPAGGSAGLAVAVGATGDAILALVDAAAGRLRLERRRGGVHETVTEADLADLSGLVTLELIAYDDEVVARVGDAEVRARRGAQRDGRVALVGSAGARVSRLAVEPVEAYAIDVMTSRWRTFDAHIAAHRDGAALEIVATGAELAAWLAAEWDAIAAAIAPDADPRARGTVFRRALETLGIPAVESPREPALTRLLADGASAALLVEGPEPLPFSADVSATFQRRPRRPFPHPHFPFDDRVVLDPGGGSPAPTPATRPGRFPIGPRPSVLTADVEVLPLPVEPPQWIDVPTLVLTDDDERRALIIPVEPSSRTPLALGGAPLRIRFELDRERYRSAAADPAARSRASVTRSLPW
jgi:hypothetical protein